MWLRFGHTHYNANDFVSVLVAFDNTVQGEALVGGALAHQNLNASDDAPGLKRELKAAGWVRAAGVGGGNELWINTAHVSVAETRGTELHLSVRLNGGPHALGYIAAASEEARAVLKS